VRLGWCTFGTTLRAKERLPFTVLNCQFRQSTVSAGQADLGSAQSAYTEGESMAYRSTRGNAISRHLLDTKSLHGIDAGGAPAGMLDARAPTTSSTSTETMNVAGSCAERPKIRFEASCVVARATHTPSAMAAITIISDSRSTSQSRLTRCEPSASRTPISLVRRETL
jgi:hypothetical protein